MKQYLQNLQSARNASKFNMIYEAIMQDLDIYKQVPANTAKLAANKSLTLIVEEINKPQYIICESCRELLLEEAIFMSDEYLISEGIFDKVSEKIQQLIEYIKAGIKKVLSKSSDVIKAFCEKVKENKVVAAIRKKLGLDEKLKAENFKKFVKVKAAGKEVAEEAVYSFLNDEHIITEATKLSKKEEAITDPKELETLIKKWEDAVSGKTPIKNAKTGKPLTKGYCQDKLRLLKKKMASLKNDGESKTETKADEKTSKNISVKGEKNSDLKVNKDKPIGDIHFSVDGISNYIKSVKESSTSEETIDAATQTSAIAVGGDKVANVITGDSAPPEESAEEPKKKGLLGKIKSATKKISAKADEVGNKMKDKIKSVASKAKAWFNAQNKWVKILICAIIAVLALLAIYWLITSVIFPIIYGIMNGGVINAAMGILRLYASGKTFIATYKQGKKSWQTGEGWGKTFLFLGASILAAINLGQMASNGSEMMAAADQAKNTASAAGEGAKATVGNGISGANPYDLEYNGKLKLGGTITGPDGTQWTIEDLGDRGYAKTIDGIQVSTKLPDGSTVSNYIKWKDIHKGPERIKQIFEVFGKTKDLEF